MPVYNAEKHLQEAIESILNQTFTDFELLLINEGSTDACDTIIRSFKDSRIRYVINDENLKLIKTLNRGLQLAKGKYIARMDADDIAEPNRLQLQFEFMEANPNIGVCGTGFHSFGSVDSITNYPETDARIKFMALYQCPFCHPSVILRNSVVRENNLTYSLNYPHAEDYEFWLRMGRVSELANLQSVLLHYRQHDESVSVTEENTQIRLSEEIRKMYFQELGVNASPEELELFRKANYQYQSFDIDQVRALGKLLERMVSAGQKSAYIDDQSLRPLISELWQNTCINHAKHGLGVWSIYKATAKKLGVEMSGSNQLKLWVKCLLKIDRS